MTGVFDMPLIEDSDYQPPWYWRNAHLQTILPNRVRRVRRVGYQVEPAELDGAVVDLYWSHVGSECIAVVAHGLGGHVYRPYMLGMVGALNRAGCDAVAWHVWGTDDREPGPHFCHGGTTTGLRSLVQYLAGRYRRVVLVGFSLGGNVVLKYLGEEGEGTCVAGAVALSVPCDLLAAADRLSQPGNRVYLNSFLRTLKATVRRKAHFMPDRVTVEGLRGIKSLFAFDDQYTAPLNGFADAYDYYGQCSSGPYLDAIRIPTLLVNARNDPFLPETCYPVETCRSHECVSLEMPDSGGHLGFPLGCGAYWAESRAVQFFSGLRFLN